MSRGNRLQNKIYYWPGFGWTKPIRLTAHLQNNADPTDLWAWNDVDLNGSRDHPYRTPERTFWCIASLAFYCDYFEHSYNHRAYPSVCVPWQQHLCNVILSDHLDLEQFIKRRVEHQQVLGANFPYIMKRRSSPNWHTKNLIWRGFFYCFFSHQKGIHRRWLK